MTYGNDILEILLKDRTTDNHIIWTTGKQITIEDISTIQPRFKKNIDAQRNRTRQNAEIFTPAWVCDFQNNLVDNNNCREDYVDAKCLEISCGEAPYLVSRYDAVTGEAIPISDRIGLLDRKFRVVDKFTHNDNDWIKWSYRAVESVYGFDIQGDNVFLARKNILDTYADYFATRFNYDPPTNFLTHAAKIISWNIWQMDAKTYTSPFSNILCKVIDWRENEIVTFKYIGDPNGEGLF